VSVKLSRLRTAMSEGRWAHDTVVDTAGYIGCLAMVNAKLQEHFDETAY
jgi:hypothetical protein